jgi:alkanesulfonate monooxygenase SsuD/methylene tetrahydromethanopterin reductase-like flavin-dependent oxidoreductase (luciferase family)
LKLGTGIALIPQRDPIITAKSVASLDQLSGGRFVFAMGGGWNVDEMQNHGANYETRFKLLREARIGDERVMDEGRSAISRRVRQLRSRMALSETEAETTSAPAPGRRERPHPETRGRILRWAGSTRPRSGWESPRVPWNGLRKAATEAGRDPKTLSISVFAAPADPAKLCSLSRGRHRSCVARVPDLGRDEVLRILDKNAALMRA